MVGGRPHDAEPRRSSGRCPSLTTIDFIDDGSIVGNSLAVCHGTLDGEVLLDERGRVTYVPVAVEAQPGCTPKKGYVHYGNVLMVRRGV